MSKMNPNQKRTLILGVVAILIVALVGFAALTYFSGADNNPPQDTIVPQLETQNLAYNDNRSNPTAPFLHLTGQIYNSGNGTANNVTLSMYAIQNGNATAIETTVNLDPVPAGSTQNISLEFAYTGEAILAYNPPTLQWTN